MKHTSLGPYVILHGRIFFFAGVKLEGGKDVHVLWGSSLDSDAEDSQVMFSSVVMNFLLQFLF